MRLRLVLCGHSKDSQCFVLCFLPLAALISPTSFHILHHRLLSSAWSPELIMDPSPASGEAQAIVPRDAPSPHPSDEAVSEVAAALAPMTLGPVAVEVPFPPERDDAFSMETQIPVRSLSDDNSPPGGVSVFSAFNFLPDLLARFRPDKWRKKFLSNRGNEYFCEIDEEYLTDRFNLTGLNAEVPYYQYALDLITDVFDIDADDQLREQIDKSANHLYGLVHARYIVTTRGLAKMVCSC